MQGSDYDTYYIQTESLCLPEKVAKNHNIYEQS